MLKTVMGLLASKNFSNNSKQLNEKVPDGCKNILLGSPFPSFWGLYLQPSTGEFAMTDKEFWCEPLTGEGLVRAARFSLARIPLCLVLGEPDDPAFWGKRRPSYFRLQAGTVQRIFRLNWHDGPSSTGVTFSRLRDS
jgi:hypothetical protein